MERARVSQKKENARATAYANFAFESIQHTRRVHAPDSRYKARRELIIAKSQQQTTLPHACVCAAPTKPTIRRQSKLKSSATWRRVRDDATTTTRRAPRDDTTYRYHR
mgnify:CR=1 FL=1|jgi:hypothetical protein